MGQSRRGLAGGAESDFLHRSRGPGRHFWLRREPMKRSRGSGRRGGPLGCWACWASMAGVMAVGAFWGSMDCRISRAVSGPLRLRTAAAGENAQARDMRMGGGGRGRRSGVEGGWWRLCGVVLQWFLTWPKDLGTTGIMEYVHLGPDGGTEREHSHLSPLSPFSLLSLPFLSCWPQWIGTSHLTGAAVVAVPRPGCSLRRGLPAPLAVRA